MYRLTVTIKLYIVARLSCSPSTLVATMIDWIAIRSTNSANKHAKSQQCHKKVLHNIQHLYHRHIYVLV